MKLTDEEQCMLSLMEIADFPVEIQYGLFMYNRGLEIPTGYVYSNAYKLTDDFEKIKMLFERWKKINA